MYAIRSYYATAYGVDLTGIARASGLKVVDEVTDMAGVGALAARLHAMGFPNPGPAGGPSARA